VLVSQFKENGIFDMLMRSKYEIPSDKPEMYGKLWDNLEEKIIEIEERYK
jgi:hypothetical protein